MTTRLRRAAALAALAAASLTAAGCLVVTDEQAAQDGISRTIHLSATVCAGAEAREECGADALEPGMKQGLLAVRVPAGTTGPKTILATRPEGDVELAASASYAAELERIRPAGAGMRWLGYVAAPVAVPIPPGVFPTPTATPTATPGPQVEPAALAFDVTLPAGALPATFRYQLLPGYRSTGDTWLADRPVVCPDAVDEETDPTTCLDASDEALAQFHEIALNDAGVAAPAPVDAAPGTTVTLPFTAGFSRAAAGGLALSATTELPGAAAAPAAATLAPDAAGPQAAPVTVAVPAGAAPGRYAVTLAAKLGDEVRTATGTVVVGSVPPRDVTKPALTAFAAKGTPTRRSVARRGLRLTVKSSEPVVLEAMLGARKAVRRKLRAKRATLASARAEGSGTLGVKLALSRRAAKRLRGLSGGVRLSVRLAATDAAGNRTELARTLTLR